MAEGSMMAFIKGRLYNRCTMIYELLANVLEQKLYERFHLYTHEEDTDIFQQMMSTVPLEPRQAEEHISNEVVSQHLQLYKDYFQSILNGNLGSATKFWQFT